MDANEQKYSEARRNLASAIQQLINAAEALKRNQRAQAEDVSEVFQEVTGVSLGELV